MVGDFSTIPAVQTHARCHTSDRISLSIPVLIIIMLLLHSALVRQGAAAASPAGAISISTKIRTSTNESQKFGFKRSQSQSPTSTTITRLHRHILAKGARAFKSSGSADQAMRALVGSSPPKCIKKCGKCTPCKSVLVPIHTNYMPETPAEYYPEAWRCQCKGKIYNP